MFWIFDIFKINDTGPFCDLFIERPSYFFTVCFCMWTSLNGTQHTASTSMYPYRAMLETLLRYGEDAKNSHMSLALSYRNTAGCTDAVTFHNADVCNIGLLTCRSFTYCPLLTGQ